MNMIMLDIIIEIHDGQHSHYIYRLPGKETILLPVVLPNLHINEYHYMYSQEFTYAYKIYCPLAKPLAHCHMIVISYS